MPRLTAEQREELVRRALAGEPVSALAEEYGVTRQAIGALMARRQKAVESAQAYPDGFANGYAMAFCAMRRMLERGVPWGRALAVMREYWLSDLCPWCEGGTGEYPPAFPF